jgi:SAM-dependent methyltransferase
LTSFHLRLHQTFWRLLPSRARDSYPIRRYGDWLHRLVCSHSARRQYVGTLFLRNRPALELMRQFALQKVSGSTLRITVLGCSVGAEVYSIAWTVRSARPDLKVVLHAVDLSEDALNIAEKGVYTSHTATLVGAPLFERLTAQEKREMFDWDGDRAKVKSRLREGITWCLNDASDPELIQKFGPQDIVVASNFLCHLVPSEAEKCLRNIERLTAPGGHVFVSGVDLDVRTKVAVDLGWEPVHHLMTEIHNGDPSVRADWPLQWWGLEPLNCRRPDSRVRYAAVFRIAGGQASLAGEPNRYAADHAA